MLHVDAVPALDDVEGADVEEGPRVLEHELVDRGLVERRDGVVVFVGLYEDIVNIRQSW